MKAKLKGKQLPDEGDDEKPERTQVIDLVARLQESLAKTSGRKRATGRVAGKTAAKRTTTKGARKCRVS